MADYVVNQNERFEFSYSAKQQEEIERIRNKYIPKEESKMEQLIRLDKKAERPGQIVAMTLGIIGSLILGVGMCCILVWNTSMMVFIAGIVTGCVGLIMMGLAYPMNKKITRKERAKIADQVIALSNEISLN